MTRLYTHDAGKLFLNGCPLTMERARSALAFHTRRAEVFARVEPEHEIAASLRDELLCALAHAVAHQLADITTGLEGVLTDMRALIAAEERAAAGDNVIPFQRRS